MLRALLSYEADKVRHGKKLIIPIIILAAFLYFNYSIKPLEVLPSFSTTSMILFAVMVALGVMYNDIDYSMIENSMLVSVRKSKMLYLGKVLTMSCIGIMASVICIMYPVLVSLLNGGTLFTRTLSVSDIVSGIVLCSLCAITGGCFGLIANRRIFHKREIIIGTALLFVIFTAAKKAIMTGPVMQVIYVVIPPIYNMGEVYSRNEYVDILALSPYIAWGLLYITAESVIYVVTMDKLKN